MLQRLLFNNLGGAKIGFQDLGCNWTALKNTNNSKNKCYSVDHPQQGFSRAISLEDGMT
jgi:hypothetical protein